MKWSLRTKMIAIIVLAGILPLALSLLALEVTGYRHLVSVKGRAYEREALHVAATLQRILERDIRNLTSLITVGQIPEMIPRLAAGKRLPEGPAIAELEAKWSRLAGSDPEVAWVVNNELSRKLQDFQREHPIFAEVLAADAEGRLVAATAKPSDYDQSDESWWQISRKLPKGAALLEGLHFDVSSQTFSLDIALPVPNPTGAGPAVGVIKVVVNASALFAAIPILTPDFDAVVEVVNEQGAVLLQLSDASFVPRGESISEKAVRHLTPSQSGWFLAPLNDGDRQMVGFAPFSLLGTYAANRLASSVPLYVVVYNRASAVVAPLTWQLTLVGIGGLALILAFGGAGYWLSQNHVIKPLTVLRGATDALASTTRHPGSPNAIRPDDALVQVAQIRTGDEIQALANDFTAMAQQLIRHQKNLQEEIAAKTAELRDDLEMARELQNAFLPGEYPRIPAPGEPDPLTLNFHHLYQSALTVSGDFCDVIKLSPHRVGIFIADVMGHGTRSALVTAILRTLIHTIAKEITDPAWFLTTLNRHFYETMKQTDQLIFATACYIVLDTQERTAWCASAGHASPICSNRLSGITDLFFDNLKNNPALGLRADAAYTPFTRRLRKGDVFLLFTDGVIEALNEQDEEFGQTRLLGCVEHFQHQSLSVLTHAIVGAVRQFTGKTQFTDDLCLLAAEAVANSAAGDSPSALVAVSSSKSSVS